MTFYPALEDVLWVHRTLIERFGGAHSLRDQGALESAIARPQTGYYRDLIEEAAALSAMGFDKNSQRAGHVQVSPFCLNASISVIHQDLRRLYALPS